MNIKECSDLSLRNRASVESASICGCYFCVSVFDSKDVKDWIDNDETALCPLCGIDSVIAEKEIPIEIDFLEKASQYWFWK